MSKIPENTRRFRTEEQGEFRRKPYNGQTRGREERREDRRDVRREERSFVRRDDRREERRDVRREERSFVRRDDKRDFRKEKEIKQEIKQEKRRDFVKSDKKSDRKFKDTYYQNSKICIWKGGEENIVEKCYVSSHQKFVEKDSPKNFQWKEGKIYCENRKPLKHGEEYVYDRFGNQLFEEERIFEEASCKFVPDVGSKISKILTSEVPKRFNAGEETYVRPNVGLGEYKGCIFAVFKYDKENRGFVQVIPQNHFFRISETHKWIEIKKIDSKDEYRKAPTSLISTVKLVEKPLEQQEETIQNEIEQQEETTSTQKDVEKQQE